MALIDVTQRNLLIDKAVKESLFQVDLNSLETNFKSAKLESFGITNQYGNPTFGVLTPKLGAPIQMVAIKKQTDALKFDIKVLKVAHHEYIKFTSEALRDLNQQISSLNKLANNLLNKIIAEKARIQDKAKWVYSDSFNTSFNIDLASSNIFLDTVEGLVTLPTTLSNIIPLEVNQLSGQQFNVTSTPQDLLNNKSWKINCLEDKVSSKVSFKLSKLGLKAIVIEPTGFDTTLDITVYGKTITTQTVVIYNKTTIPIEVEEVENVEITLSCSSTVLPKVVGIKSISFLSLTSNPSGLLQTKQFTIPTFNYIRINPTEIVPPNSRIDWSWYNGTSWKKIPVNQWVAISDINYQTLNIPSLNLQTQGKYSLDFETFSTKYEGKLQVGVDQFEVTAELTSGLGKGNLIELPLKEKFKGEKTAWTNPTLLNVTPLDTPCPVQVASKGTSNPNYIAGGSLVGSSTTPLGPGLTWVPISGDSKSLQSNFMYRFSVQLFCEESITISDSAYWFIQGFKQLGSPSYKQSKYSLGSFSVYINNNLVCGETYADTIYEDDSAELAAKNSTGRSFNMSLQSGWNTLDIYLYCPKIPEFLADSTHLFDYLQLTIFPNIFDNNIRTEYGITRVIGSGEFNPISYFDLNWKVPRDFRYWAWSEIDDATIQFNTKSTPLIDFFYGGNKSNSYPNIVLVYLSQESANETTTKFRANLTSTNPGSRPSITSVEILTR